jgi:tripartite-type tricarboxylate transporter receptor subunit TctC
MDLRKIWMACAAGALTIVAPIALSQTYPNKPVRVIVGFATGGTVDIVARIVAAKLSEIWATSVLVDNRPGAGSSISADIAAKASPDGYTLLICGIGTHAVIPAIYRKLPYDPVRDFAPISQIGTTPNVLIVHPSVQAKSVSEFIAYAKANPGKISIASSGVGGSPHLSLELFKSMTGIDVVHVPYKGGAPALADLLGGQVPALFSNLPISLKLIKAGKVRALGITSAKRHPQLPDVLTIAESGVPGYEVTSWQGMCAPAAVPKPLLVKLNADLVKVLNMPDTQQRLAEQGVDAAPTTSDQFASHIRSEIIKWAKVVKEAGITAE